jgi:biopolymer transport protein ExbD
MASVNSTRGGRSPIVGINVTPFVDITLCCSSS